MKRLNKKLTVQLGLAGVVAVSGALAIAQAWPRLRSGAKSPEVAAAGTDKNAEPSTAMAPIPAPRGAATRQINPVEMPTVLNTASGGSPARYADRDDRPTEAPRWEGADTGYDTNIAVEREMQVPATYNETPAFDQPPRQADVTQADFSSDPYADRPLEPSQTGKTAVAVGDETDQFATQPLPPLVDASVAEPGFDPPANLTLAGTSGDGRLEADSMVTAGAMQSNDGFADTLPLEPLESAPQLPDAQPNMAQEPLAGLVQDNLPPLAPEGADWQYEDQPGADVRQQDLPAGAPRSDVAAAEPGYEPAYAQTPSFSQDVPAQPLLVPTAGGANPEPRELARGTLDTAGVTDAQPPYDGTAATGKPGPVELEGPRTPSLTIEKTAPAEIRVGTTSKFLVTVKNVGQVAADQVVVRDEVPHGTRLISTVPRADQLSDGTLVWQMGTIKPGEEATATMELAPMEEGPVGSVATVSFQTSASARAVATKPQLEIEQVAPRQALVGEDVIFSIRLSNPGTGSAMDVVLQENVPAGLTHSAGSELEYEVGTLKPGEERQLELTLKADKPGVVHNVLVVRADANLSVRDAVQIEVVAPQLQVQLDGPARRYLNRPATFSLSLENPGTAPAQDIELVAHLPRGLKFVNTNNAGYYDQATHAVHWNLQELPAGEMGSVQMTVLPIEMGQLKVRADANAQMGLSHASEKQILVEGLAALLFTVGDENDPIEVGGQTTYEIRIVNQGTKDATNVRLAAAIPQGMRAIGGDGPTQVTVGPQQVVFEPLSRLNPQADASFKIHVQGDQPGDKRFRVQVIADDMSQPVTKEESTRVYAD